MKKIVSIVLSLIIIFSINIVFASDFNVVVETKEAEPGETVEIKVSLENNSGLLAALFDLEYNTERLKLTNVSDGGLLAGAFFSPSYSSYPYKMIWNSSSYENFTEDGTLVTLTFKVLNNAEKGDAFINLSYDEDNVYDVDLNNVDVNVINGHINVLPSGNDAEIENEYYDEDITEDDETDISLEDITSSFQGIITTPSPEIPQTSVENQLTFNDVKNSDWYFNSVKFAYNNGLMNGTSENTFSPNSFITRGMFVTVLYRIEKEPEALTHSFDDVNSSAYYNNAVAWAAENSIVNGISENSFAPDSNITREQIATIMYRYIKYKNALNENIDVTNPLSFDDYNIVSPFAIEAITYAVNTGLLNGKSATALAPQDNATRAEIATIFQRFLSK